MIPELEGFESFWKWYLRGSVTASDQCVELAERLCAGLSFKTLLDYGCGKQANAVLKFYEKGIKVTGYDPGQGMMARWHKTVAPREGLTLTDVRAEAVSGGPYDLVICSLVLCEIPTEEGLKDVLDDLKQAVDKAGHVIVIICDPVATFGPCTAVHKVRELPEGATYPTAFGYQEVVESGRRRSEWHRSARAIKRALLQAGLLITKELSSSAYELEAGLPASDFLGWTCKPANLVSEKSKVSLVIKASALEGGALVRQVEHLVGQLEAPRAFAERILVLDSKKAGFVREYAVPDPSQVLVAAEDLISRGLIDRVVMTPADSTDACALLNERWFGLGANCSHTSSGAPLAAPLSAFEACRSDYILQVDADLLIRRKELTHDYLGELVGALRATPGAVTVSLSVLQDGDTAFEAHDKDGKPFRVGHFLIKSVPTESLSMLGTVRWTWPAVMAAQLACAEAVPVVGLFIRRTPSNALRRNGTL
jgi:hypothetical protein